MHALISAAFDHLATMVDAMDGSGKHRVFGTYALIRASIEASALGLWIISPGTVNARVLRSLKLYADQIGKTEDLAAKMGRPVALPGYLDELNRIKDRRKGLRQRSLEPMTTLTNILIDVGRTIRDKAVMAPMPAWSACASMSHANKVAAIYLLQPGKARDVRSGASEYAMSADYELTARLLATATSMLRELIDRTEAHARG